MRKALMSMMCLAAMAVLVTGCGKYSDVKREMTKLSGASESFADQMDKADSAAAAAKAINNYADKMEKIAPRLKKLTEKYPELKDQNEPPEELKESHDKAQESMEKMMKASKKIVQYMDDEAVQEAQKRLNKIMSDSMK